MRTRHSCTGPLEKLACGRFSDISSVAAGKRRDFCQLRRWRLMRRKSDKPTRGPRPGLRRSRVLAYARPRIPGVPEAVRRHAMISGVITDIGKEASIARSRSTDDETRPTFGAQFAPSRQNPIWAAPRCSRARPGVGPPPHRDLRVASVSSPRDERAIGLRGIWRAGRFQDNSRRVRPTQSPLGTSPLPRLQWRDASMDSSHTENTRLADTLAARCDCNLHSSRAQFVEGANRVFDQQIDAS
jgi:hypothetical protein